MPLSCSLACAYLNVSHLSDSSMAFSMVPSDRTGNTSHISPAHKILPVVKKEAVPASPERAAPAPEKAARRISYSEGIII